MTPQEQVLEQCRVKIALAEQLYKVDLGKVTISFDLRGNVAGCAAWKRRGGVLSLYLKFNQDMLSREAFNHILKDTVPHEVAHLVCYVMPVLGRNHDAGWTRICIQLGGSGERCHREDVVYGTGITYEYVSHCGSKTLRVSQKLHAAITAGKFVTFNKGTVRIDSSCAYSIVGVRGKTLAQPIVKAAGAPPPQLPPSIAPAARPAAFQTEIDRGVTKASIARAVMHAAHAKGHSYEDIIQAIMVATGHTRQLSRSYYKGNYLRVGCPAP
jgi:predicted SprT family Zn-dependent metalloprotease